MVGALVIVLPFAAAWLLARAAGFVALKVLVWNDRRVADTDLTQAGRLRRLKRRETQVSIIRAAVTYLGFATAAVLSVGQLIGGVDRLTALAGASFLLILVGFSIQRVLMDIIAGLVMFMERWYSVGDTIQIPMHELQGIVEDVSLRHTRLRTLDGEVIHIHNSQIPSVRVLPSGVKGCSSRCSSPTVSAASRWSSPLCRSFPRARRPSFGDLGSTASTSSARRSCASARGRRSRPAANGSWTASSPTYCASGPSPA